MKFYNFFVLNSDFGKIQEKITTFFCYISDILRTRRKKIYLNLRNRVFNLISSMRSENTVRTNINLFDFKKSRFEPFLNKRNYFTNINHITHVLMRLRRLSFLKFKEKKLSRNFFKSKKLFFDRARKKVH